MRHLAAYLLLLLTIQASAGVQVPRHYHSPDAAADSLYGIVRAIEQVTVTATVADKAVIPAQTLAGENLRVLNAHSVADAMRYFSGVQLKDYGGVGGLKTVNVRSMGSHHLGVFYDGVQVGNAQNGIVDLGRFSLDNMEAVSLYNSQKSGVLQSAKDYASGSSLYLRTRVPLFREGSRRNLSATVKGGSFATINPSALWEEKLNGRLTLSANGEFLYTSGRYRFTYSKKDRYDTTAVRTNGDVRALRAETALFGRTASGEWKAKVYLYDSQRGYPGASVKSNPDELVNEDRQWDTDLFAQGSFRTTFSRLYTLSVNGKASYNFLHYIADYKQKGTTKYSDEVFRQWEGYVSAANALSPAPWLDINAAADLLWNRLDSDQYGFAYPRRLTVLGTLAATVRRALFDIQASVLYTGVTETTRRGPASPTRNEWAPAVTGSVIPFEGFTVRAFYKEIFRMPTFNDLYYVEMGSVNLCPEYARQFNAGVHYLKNNPGGHITGIELQADAYYNRVKDKIVAMPTSNQFRWTMLNFGRVKIKGLDTSASLNGQAGSIGWSVRLTYTWQRAADTTDPEDEYYGGLIPYAPVHSGSAIAGLTYRGFYLNYSYIYTGERYTSRANIPVNREQPWYTHDLSLTKHFHVGGYRLRAAAEVNNIFNQQYEVVRCYPMPGTNVKLIITLTL